VTDRTATRRLRAAIRKEFRQIVRDPLLLILVLWLYSVEIVLCAISLSFDLRKEPIAVVDLDRSRASMALAERFDRAPSFGVRHRPATVETARVLLEQGDARLVVVLPRGYEGELAREGTADVQLVVDGSNSILALNAAGQAQRIVVRSWQDILAQYAAPLPAFPQVENRVRIWYNPDLRFAFEQVLTSIALAAFMVAVIIPAALIVKEKESGTIEQVLVTPLRFAELILAKTVPMFVIGMLALGPSMLIARLFGLPFRGNPLTFAALSAALLVGAIATGVLIAASVRTMQQALLVAFFVTVPILFLSGTMTPVENMPPALQAAARLSPMRYYVESLPAIVLKGAGIELLWKQLLWLLGLGAALFALASVVFRRRLL
jgi:ABC-2 type transport system permease protein